MMMMMMVVVVVISWNNTVVPYVPFQTNTPEWVNSIPVGLVGYIPYPTPPTMIVVDPEPRDVGVVESGDA